MIFIGTLFCTLHRDANGLHLRQNHSLLHYCTSIFRSSCPQAPALRGGSRGLNLLETVNATYWSGVCLAFTDGTIKKLPALPLPALESSFSSTIRLNVGILPKLCPLPPLPHSGATRRGVDRTSLFLLRIMILYELTQDSVKCCACSAQRWS